MFKSGLRSLNRVRFYSTITPIQQYGPNLLSLKVGKIVDIKPHENASKLYVSQVQISNSVEDTIQICSGLVPYMPPLELLQTKIIVLANLKKSKMRGVESQLMLLAATKIDPDNGNVSCEVVRPSEGSEVGDQLVFEGYDTPEQSKIIKSKQLSQLIPQLRTNTSCEVIYVDPDTEKPHFLHNSRTGGHCIVKTLSNASVS